MILIHPWAVLLSLPYECCCDSSSSRRMQAVSLHTKEGMGMEPAQLCLKRQQLERTGVATKRENSWKRTTKKILKEAQTSWLKWEEQVLGLDLTGWGNPGKEQKGRWGGEKSLCFTQVGGKTILAALQPLGFSNKRSWGRGLVQETFLVSLKSRKLGGSSTRLSSEPSWADFLLLAAGVAVGVCRDGTGPWTGWLQSSVFWSRASLLFVQYCGWEPLYSFQR